MKLLIVFILTFISLSSAAGEFPCSAKINALMADHPSCIDQSGKKQFAFKIVGSNYWKCSDSDTASSLVLAARISGQGLSIYISDANGATCANHKNYIKPNYIILNGQ